jgi:hypothetical protein
MFKMLYGAVLLDITTLYSTSPGLLALNLA